MHTTNLNFRISSRLHRETGEKRIFPSSSPLLLRVSMCYIIVVCIISPMRFFFHLALNQQLFLPFSSPLLKTKTKSSKLAETKVEDNFEEDLELDKQVVDTDKKYLSLLFLLLLCRIIITYVYTYSTLPEQNRTGDRKCLVSFLLARLTLSTLISFNLVPFFFYVE